MCIYKQGESFEIMKTDRSISYLQLLKLRDAGVGLGLDAEAPSISYIIAYDYTVLYYIILYYITVLYITVYYVRL